MKIRWFGQSCFLIESEKRVRVVTDPFDSSLGYKVPRLRADIVTVSHEHFDHNATRGVRGNPVIMRGVGGQGIKGVFTKGVSVFHDKVRGAQRGINTIFVLEIDGIRIVHLGDLGHTLSPEQVRAIGGVDILFIPVGGTFTIDAREADEVVEQLNPKIIIPMHYKTPAISLTIDGVDKFLSNKQNIEKRKELKISKKDLPEEAKVIVLEYKV